jgi:hypothetical protein
MAITLPAQAGRLARFLVAQTLNSFDFLLLFFFFLLKRRLENVILIIILQVIKSGRSILQLSSIALK